MTRLLTAFTVLGALAARPALAQQVTIHIDEDLAQQAGVDVQEVENQLNGELRSNLKLDDQAAYMEKMASAAISSTKGMGADYASNPQRFVVGGSLGSAANGSGVQFSRGDEDLPQGGFAFQAMGMAGLNLGIAASDDSVLRRVVVYVNGMMMSNSKEPFSASLYNYGAHAQIKLIRPPHKGLVEWGGLDLTSGYEASSYTLGLSQAIPIPADPVTWDATGTYDIHSTAQSVPVELSSNLRVSVATVYVGGAMDFNLEGQATSDIGLGGDITVDAAGSQTTIGDISVSYSTRGEAAAQVPRVFGGVQVNVLMVKVYGHMNVGLDNSVGGHLGLRVAI